VFYYFARFVGRCLSLLFFGYRSYGARSVPATGPVILASTHQSFLDPIFVEIPLSRQAWIMARRSLFGNPAFSLLIRSLHAFPIERGTADLSALHQSVELLREGDMLLMFPEATRTRTGEIGNIQRGIGIIAHRADAPVIPVTIDGAFECWPPGRKLFRPGPVRVMFGKPMRVEATDRATLERFVRELRERLVAQQEELRRLRRCSSFM